MPDGETKDRTLPALDRNRSLVFIERRRNARCHARAPSDFLAQLIACEQHLGLFRRARRVEPEVGAACYRPKPTRPEPSLVRSL